MRVGMSYYLFSGGIMRKFQRFAWGVLFYNVLVIVFGAFVRATGSGAGCGSHWPLCNGEVVPRAPQVETLIEWTHRLTSGISVIFILMLVFWVWRNVWQEKNLRYAVLASMFFIFTESLIGAGLVLFGLVGDNASVGRAISMMAHLVNTFLLLASLTCVAWFATFHTTMSEKNYKKRGGWLVGALGMLALGASGAIAALGDTLFPSSSLMEGIMMDFDPLAHFLIRLRVFHPAIAIIVGGYVIILIRFLIKSFRSAQFTKIGYGVIALIIGQWLLGIVNVITLAPVGIQLIHLLLTTLIWIGYVIVGIFCWVGSDFSLRITERPIHNWINGTPT